MSIVLQGLTSGSITLQEPAIAGSNTISLPASTGTVALTENFTGSNVSLTANGYQKFPSGLIMQWCESSVQTGEIDITVTYPIAFPTAVLQVVVGTDADTSPADIICTLVSKTTSDCVVRFQSIGATGSTKAVVFAIGY